MEIDPEFRPREIFLCRGDEQLNAFRVRTLQRRLDFDLALDVLEEAVGVRYLDKPAEPMLDQILGDGARGPRVGIIKRDRRLGVRVIAALRA